MLQIRSAVMCHYPAATTAATAEFLESSGCLIKKVCGLHLSCHVVLIQPHIFCTHIHQVRMGILMIVEYLCGTAILR